MTTELKHTVGTDFIRITGKHLTGDPSIEYCITVDCATEQPVLYVATSWKPTEPYTNKYSH